MSPSRKGNIFPQGQPVTLTAKPKAPAFVFAGWQFDGLGPMDHPSLSTVSTTFVMTDSVVAMAGFMTVLAAPMFEVYEGRVLNTHPSLLPAFPGAHAVMDAGVDEGIVHDDIAALRQRREDRDVGHEAAAEEQRTLGAKERGRLRLQCLVLAMIAA